MDWALSLASRRVQVFQLSCGKLFPLQCVFSCVVSLSSCRSACIHICMSVSAQREETNTDEDTDSYISIARSWEPCLYNAYYGSNILFRPVLGGTDGRKLMGMPIIVYVIGHPSPSISLGNISVVGKSKFSVYQNLAKSRGKRGSRASIFFKLRDVQHQQWVSEFCVSYVMLVLTDTAYLVWTFVKLEEGTNQLLARSSSSR